MDKRTETSGIGIDLGEIICTIILSPLILIGGVLLLAFGVVMAAIMIIPLTIIAIGEAVDVIMHEKEKSSAVFGSGMEVPLNIRDDIKSMLTNSLKLNKTMCDVFLSDGVLYFTVSDPDNMRLHIGRLIPQNDEKIIGIVRESMNIYMFDGEITICALYELDKGTRGITVHLTYDHDSAELCVSRTKNVYYENATFPENSVEK